MLGAPAQHGRGSRSRGLRATRLRHSCVMAPWAPSGAMGTVPQAIWLLGGSPWVVKIALWSQGTGVCALSQWGGSCGGGGPASLSPVSDWPARYTADSWQEQ